MALHRLPVQGVGPNWERTVPVREQEVVLHSLTRLAPESTVFSKGLQVCRTFLFKAEYSLNSFS